MQARVIRGFIRANYVLISLALFALSLYSPAPVYGGVYADVENCLAANPAPDGCYNYTRTSTNGDGQTVYTVYQRCGHVVAHVKSYTKEPLLGTSSCGYYPNLGYDPCVPGCLNGGMGVAYWGYHYIVTTTTYCDGKTETITSDNTANDPQGFWRESHGDNPVCLRTDQTYDCSQYDRLLCTVVIDPCEGSKDPCCRDKCCGNHECCPPSPPPPPPPPPGGPGPGPGPDGPAGSAGG